MIVLDHVSRRFDDILAVDDVSMQVDKGTITVIVGTSGSGKSTTLRMINRLIEPTSGIITIEGRNIANVPGEILRRSIGYVIQDYGLFPHWTVERNIATVPALLGWDKRRIAARVGELLRLFQLDPETYRTKFPHQLSGGQRQRVGVARALAAEPALLLMDEPFGALDPLTRTGAQRELLEIQRRLGITVVLVTHDLEEAILLGDHIAVMDGGKLLQYATPIELLVNPTPGFVERLVDNADRPLRLLSLTKVEQLAEKGEAPGEPIDKDVSLRDALSELLWRQADRLPVSGLDSSAYVSLPTILAHARRPE